LGFAVQHGMFGSAVDKFGCAVRLHGFIRHRLPALPARFAR
jgi:hypothetical protein